MTRTTCTEHNTAKMNTAIIGRVNVANNCPEVVKDEADCKRLAYIGRTVNKWRGRTIALYQHPTLPDHVISVGRTFDGALVVIASELKSDWATALDYIEHGQVYVSN